MAINWMHKRSILCGNLLVAFDDNFSHTPFPRL